MLNDLSEHVRMLVRCPVCGAGLKIADTYLDCADPACGTRFPVVDGVPILINDDNSLFSVEDFTRRRAT